MREPDPQIIAAARRGDSAAFDSLILAYQSDVWRLALYLVRDDSLAEDVTQEVFVRVFRFLKRFRGDSKFSTWVFSITRNCARDVLKKAGKEEQVIGRMQHRPDQLGPDPALGYEIKSAIRSLSIELREPLVLVDMFELSYKEVGRMLRLPVGTVKSRVFRSRQILIEMLGPRAGENVDEA